MARIITQEQSEELARQARREREAGAEITLAERRIPERVRLNALAGLHPRNPWAFQLAEDELTVYLAAAEAGRWDEVPLPIWTNNRGLRILANPIPRERTEEQQEQHAENGWNILRRLGIIE